MRFILCGVLIGVFAASSQANEATPAFEVILIKPSAGAAPVQFDRGFIHYPSISLKFLIVQAYKIHSNQIDGPSWLAGPPDYDFTAKLPQGATKAQIPAMLQATLAERFKLKVHQEPRVEPVYELVTEMSGLKLKKSDAATPYGMSISSGSHYSLRANTMEQFATTLSAHLGRPVFDKTGISGTFDIDFEIEPLAGPQQLPAFTDLATSSDPPSIFSVLHSLGLKLRPAKADVNHLVVDSALKVPTDNQSHLATMLRMERRARAERRNRDDH